MRGMVRCRGAILLLIGVRGLRAARRLLAYLQVRQRPRYGAVVERERLGWHLVGGHHCSEQDQVLLAEHAEPDMSSRRR